VTTPKREAPEENRDALFDRIVTILEEARGRVVRAVNTGMVTAYWLIGREIVEALQGGEERAEYGREIIEKLSKRLTERYGRGFSGLSLQRFRKFYLVYRERLIIPSPPGTEFEGNEIPSPSGTEMALSERLHLPGGESTLVEKQPQTGAESAGSHPIPSPSGMELASAGIRYLAGSDSASGFSPLLSWSHYRALMRVADAAARTFYEREAAECGWSKAQLERQIQSSYYQRILANRGEAGLSSKERGRLPGEPINAGDVLKSPYVLEFLGLPDAPELHESVFEQAIIDNLQSFLLELGKGFSFVARQQQIRFDDEDFYVDLVFYNFILKCFLLIDLKMGKLTHRDVGQMDGYVRLFEDRFKVPGDNPTIGLILCSDKGEAVAKYSVLSEGRQIFASKYLQFLPSEEELRIEIQKERRLIEAALQEKEQDNE
jgi:predicted nuclease of restriction endonuclease-like (RecB) superfamily